MMASEEGKVELFSYWRSSCSWRVRLALAFKKIAYEYKSVNLLQRRRIRQAEPNAKVHRSLVSLTSESVPTLVIDNKRLCQSIAILEYLEETRPDIPLLPKDPYQRSLVRQLVQSIVSDIQPVQNLRVLKKVGDDKKAEWAKYWIEFGFAGVEKTLASTASTYCVGDSVTFADLCLVPQVYNANRFGVDMSQFPIIHRISEALSKLPEFQAAHPDAQPDAVKS